VYIAVSETEARRCWTRNRITRERGDIRDDDFLCVAQHFEPPANDEAAVRCGSTQSLHEWIDLVRTNAEPKRWVKQSWTELPSVLPCSSTCSPKKRLSAQQPKPQNSAHVMEKANPTFGAAVQHVSSGSRPR
jgi:hypothetical protein